MFAISKVSGRFDGSEAIIVKRGTGPRKPEVDIERTMRDVVGRNIRNQRDNIFNHGGTLIIKIVDSPRVTLYSFLFLFAIRPCAD